ncbi:gamma-glutamyltranspeptidase [Apiospora phragmitis]|uniref:Gamma-glutamyltranspeptidase n=1 Tax=Apiospora phragmitis TaxID=2905665 RepID=A0ABR1VQ68_9PEZI
MPLTVPSVFPPGSDPFMKFASRRSVVHSTKGIVACTQPLAAKCGIEILDVGGNCADAAVAVAAGLNITEPASTGIGGDVFCLYYDAATKKISALNGSGRAGSKCTLETIRKDLGLEEGDKSGKIDMQSVHAVTVPGAPAGWCDTVERFGSGKVTLEQILAPAIELGEKGFPVSELVTHYWAKAEPTIRAASPNFREMLKDDPSAPDGVRAPRPGEIMKNLTLAKTFRTLATEGKKGFYTGRIAEELVKIMGSEPVDPISLKFRGQGVAEALRDNILKSGGIVALMALGIIQELEAAGTIPTFTRADFNTPAYLHVIVEALRIAFADASWWVTDPNVEKVPSAGLISPEYLRERAKLFDPARVTDKPLLHGQPSPALQSSDTVYFACSDSQGNAISFINSNYGGFGTCIIPKGCGFTLQNRGANFSLDKDHPNVLAPRKRPYHTIIPAAVTNLHDGGSLHSVYGVMGGFMQPQGHVQTLLSQIVGGLNPQQALDAPRVCIGAGMPDEGEVMDRTVYVEEGMSEETIEGLKKLGHKVEVLMEQDRGMFGRGQIIRWSVDAIENVGIWSAGSDMRGDGAAHPQ